MPTTIFARIRTQLSKPRASSHRLAVLSAAFVALVNNFKLYGLLFERLDLHSASGAAAFFTIYLALTGIVSAVFLLVGFKYVLKPLIITVMLLSAVFSYFTQQLGVVFDQEMIRNIFETVRDRNTPEALELLSFSLALHVLLLGALPAILVARTSITYRPPVREALSRAAYLGTIVAVAAVLVFGNYKYITFFVRENRDLRYFATPTYAVHSLSALLHEDQPTAFVEIGRDAAQVKPVKPRTVGIFVVGETARADHFSLNGYARETNPRLKARSLLNFPNFLSNGTSTAYCVPAMFSFLTGGAYSPRKAGSQSNTLDLLDAAGVDVIWIDNNSSSKGVAERIGSINLRFDPDREEWRAGRGEMLDEVLLDEFDEELDKAQGDVLVVLHTMGSHGPAYHRRYPPEFEVFKPACRSSAPQDCGDEQIINAYDNTILYTDYIVDELIERLEARDPAEIRFLLYASDHGESLGENGVYLHGLPRFLAPKSQYHVPAFAWLSDSYLASNAVDLEQLREAAEDEYTLENIPGASGFRVVTG